MISIISCFNDMSVVNEMLVPSLKKQCISYELILQDNTENKFSSASKALNDGIRKANGEIIVLVHQDVELGKRQLEKIVNQIKVLGENTIVGVAGVKDSTGVYTNITHGKSKKYAGRHRVSEALKVQTLDEVLIASSKNTFEKILFDEDTCNNWHLYGVDLCLSGSTKNINSYVIPIELYHKSTGVVSKDYYSSLVKVAAKHKNNFNKIYTTCSSVNTSFLKLWVYVSLRKLKLYTNTFNRKKNK